MAQKTLAQWIAVLSGLKSVPKQFQGHHNIKKDMKLLESVKMRP